MRNFLTIALALVLGFFSATVLSNVPRGLTAPSHVEMGRVASLTSLASTQSSAVKEDGVNVEISVPYFVLPIPGKKSGRASILPIGVYIKNNTPTNLQVGNETLTPELFDPNGQVLKRKEDSKTTGRIFCNIAKPGKDWFFPEFSGIFWKNNLLQLSVHGGNGGLSEFEDLKPGTYQLRFAYKSPNQEVTCLDLQTQQIRSQEELGKAEAVSTWVPLRIVQPVSINSNTVDVDGIWFETVVQKRVLPIPARRPNATTPMQVGLRIINKTPTPFRFTRLAAYMPQLVGPGGKPLEAEGGRSGGGTGSASNCPLLQPGESKTFLLDGKLYWLDNKLQLTGSDGLGGYWQFKELNPGIYQIGLGYSLGVPGPMVCGLEPGKSRPTPLKDLWQGSSANPLVEIRLVQGSDV